MIAAKPDASFLARVRRGFEPEANAAPAWLRRAALAAVMVNFAVLGLAKVNLHADPDEMDTGRYLNAALFVREHGGALALPLMCVAGVYREDVQQPLYHAVLSPFAVRDFEFFNRAKLVTLATGVLAVGACWLVGCRAFGDGPALVGAMALSWSYAFVYHATMVACEPLLTLLVLMAWGSAQGWARGRAGAGGPAGWAGLAFLTKASALLLAPAFGLYAIMGARDGRRLRRFLAWLGVLLAVASPVLVRNVVVFGNPLHNPHSAYLWLDRWEDSYRPDFEQSPPTALGYLRSHTMLDAGRRFAEGLRGVAGLLVVSVLGVFGLPGRPAAAGGVLVLGLAVAGIILDPDRARSCFTAAMVAIFVAAFSWFHAVTAASRFLLPLGPLLQLYAAAALVALLGAVPALGRRGRAGVLASGAVGLLSLGLLLGVNVHLRSLRADPLRVGRVAPGFDELKAWLESHLAPGEPYAHGPSHGYAFEWNSRPPLKAVALPLLKDAQELAAWMERQGLRLLVVDRETLERRPEALRGLMDPSKTGEAPLRPAPAPEGWTVLLIAPRSGAAYVIFERGRRGPT